MADNGTFTEEEAEEIVEVAESYVDGFERDLEEHEAPVMFEAALLAAAIFATGTDLEDEEIIEAFRESLADARRMEEESGEEGDEDEQ